MKLAALRVFTRPRVAALVLGLLALAGVGTSYALPSQQIVTTYYFDADHTQFAGERIRTCAGTTLQEGVRTAFFDVTSEPCY